LEVGATIAKSKPGKIAELSGVVVEILKVSRESGKQ